MGKRLAIFIIIIIYSVSSLCGEELTAWHIKVGGYGGINLYNSKFYSLPDISCCNIYDDKYYEIGTGLGYEAVVGIGKELSSLDNFLLGLDLSFSNLSATYSIEDKISNWIDIDNYGDLITDKHLGVSLFAISLMPNISYKLSDFPLSAWLGIKVGVLMSGKLEHYEEVISPSDYSFTNGSNRINYYSGEFSSRNKFYSALSLGIKYDIYKWNNWTLSPSLQLNYGFTNVVSSLDWKVNSAYLGFVFSKNIPKRIEVKPEPIVPNYPQLSVPKINKFEMIVNSNYINGNEIYIPVELLATKHINYSLPIIYFKHNSSEIIAGYDNALFMSLKNNNISIEFGLYNENNDTTLINDRLQAINKLLTRYNVAAINKENIKIKKYDLNKNEIDKEHPYIKFILENNDNLIIKNETISNEIEVKSVGEDTIKINTQIISDANDYQYLIEYNFNNCYNSTISDLNAKIIVNQQSLCWGSKINDTNLTTDLNITCNATDNENKVLQEDFSYKIKPKYNYTYTTATDYNNYKIIGFFAFDSDEFIAIDNNEVEHIRTLLNNGKSIEIIGLTDDFGTKDYNSKLSLQRVNAAKKLLDNAEKRTTQITIGKYFGVENEISPYNRQKQRAVIYKEITAENE